MVNIMNWFEIPAMDFKRAVTFYETVMGMQLQHTKHEGFDMGMFPLEGESGVSGAIVTAEYYESSHEGTKVYLYCGNDLQPYLDRVVRAGGMVVVPKTLITEEIGHFAMFTDSEGNLIALHSYHPDKPMPEIQTIASWFEIPVHDFRGAVDFYSKVVEGTFFEQQMGDYMMGFFPMDMGTSGVGGALVKGEHYNPSGKGSKVYLNCGDDLNPFLERAVQAGGQVVVPRTEISPEHGFFAFFSDPEGNVVGLHSFK